MPNQANLRLGIVGCGDHSHVHAAAACELQNVKIVCACDIDADKARAWVTRHGAETGYGSIEAMISHRELDGVILCTWPSQHADQIRVCVSSGIRNILCEKALVTSAGDAKLVKHLVMQHEANLVEASMHRHHPAIRRLERILASGDLGAIDCVRAAFHNYEPTEPRISATIPNWRQRVECGGGVPYDWMHYLVDACNHFNQSTPKRVFASGTTGAETQPVDRVYGIIEYENGQVGIVESSKSANFSHALQITCAHGILHLPIAWAIQGEVTITKTHRKPDWGFILQDTYQIAKTNAYALQLDNFCQVIRGSAQPVVPLRDSIVNALTTEALLLSMRERRAVDVEMA